MGPGVPQPSYDDLIHHWHQVDDDKAGAADFNTAEFAAHTWDLVRAVGYHGELDPGSPSAAWPSSSGAMTDDNRGDAFGPEPPARRRHAPSAWRRSWGRESRNTR